MASNEKEMTPIRRLADDTLLDAFKFLPRTELCSFSSISERFFSLTNHPSLPNRLLIHKRIHLVLTTTDFPFNGCTTDLRLLVQYPPQPFIFFTQQSIPVSMFFDGKSGAGNTSEELRSLAKTAIEALNGRSWSIELNIVVNAGIRFNEFNAFFSSLHSHPRFSRISFVQQGNSASAQFNSQILNIPSAIECDEVEIEHGVYFDIDDLQPIVDFMNRPATTTFDGRQLTLRLKKFKVQNQIWLHNELKKRFLASTTPLQSAGLTQSLLRIWLKDVSNDRISSTSNISLANISSKLRDIFRDGLILSV